MIPDDKNIPLVVRGMNRIKKTHLYHFMMKIYSIV